MNQERNELLADELLDGCPFCGGVALFRRPEGNPEADTHQAACRDCGAQTRFFATELLAAQAWNRRAT